MIGGDRLCLLFGIFSSRYMAVKVLGCCFPPISGMKLTLVMLRGDQAIFDFRVFCSFLAAISSFLGPAEGRQQQRNR